MIVLFLAYLAWYFSALQLPLISMKREVSERPEEPATPLLPEPSPPEGNRKGVLSFPNADTLVSQFVRVCFPAEIVPCYFSFSSSVPVTHPKPIVEREGTKRRQKMGPTSQGNVNIYRGSVLWRRSWPEIHALRIPS